VCFEIASSHLRDLAPIIFVCVWIFVFTWPQLQCGRRQRLMDASSKINFCSFGKKKNHHHRDWESIASICTPTYTHTKKCIFRWWCKFIPSREMWEKIVFISCTATAVAYTHEITLQMCYFDVKCIWRWWKSIRRHWKAKERQAFYHHKWIYHLMCSILD
jgi:hypothetical protein